MELFPQNGGSPAAFRARLPAWGEAAQSLCSGPFVRNDKTPAQKLALLEPAWLVRETPRNRSMPAAGEGRQDVGFLNLWLAAGWHHQLVGGFGLFHRLRRGLAHDKGAGTRGLRVPAPVVLLRTCVWGVLRHQGDEGPSNDALRAGFSTRPSRCGCAGYTCARDRCPSRADGRPGRR